MVDYNGSTSQQHVDQSKTATGQTTTSNTSELAGVATSQTVKAVHTDFGTRIANLIPASVARVLEEVAQAVYGNDKAKTQSTQASAARADLVSHDRAHQEFGGTNGRMTYDVVADGALAADKKGKLVASYNQAASLQTGNVGIAVVSSPAPVRRPVTPGPS